MIFGKLMPREGNFFEPTVMVGVTQQMLVTRDGGRVDHGGGEGAEDIRQVDGRVSRRPFVV